MNSKQIEYYFNCVLDHTVSSIGDWLKKLERRGLWMKACYKWLFNEEERRPIGFIIVFFLTIIISVATSLFIVAIDRHVGGWINYLWG